jgi:myo-inositol-1(or 4)-monophosphatase
MSMAATAPACHGTVTSHARASDASSGARAPLRSWVVRDDQLLEVLHDTASAVRAALDGLVDWGDAGTHAGQYLSDLAADEVALAVLERAGLGAMSEESGLHHGDRSVVVVLDPVDGSTNASRDLPWYATSLCAVDRDGARAAVVVDQSGGARFEAVRGGGARVDGRPLRPSAATELASSVVGLSGYPPWWFGWKQFRALGAVALDLCAVAGGRLDAYVDCSPSAHGAWDYLGGMLICQEAGAAIEDAWARPLITLDHAARRTPVAAGTPELLAVALEERQRFAEHPLWADERTLSTDGGGA